MPAAELSFVLPFDWDSLLAFAARRASRGVEAVAGRRYVRTLALDGRQGWVAVELGVGTSLRAEWSDSLEPVRDALLARIRTAFDLDAPIADIESHLGALAAPHPGLRVPGAFDGFELAVRAILGQQVSVKGASTLAGRFAAAFGGAVDTPFAELTHVAPAAERVAAATVEQVAALGITTARSKSILALAAEMASGRLVLEPGGDVERTMRQLVALPGIGDWTAHYVAMRALRWAAGFPAADLGVLRAMTEETPRRAVARAEAWRPWRAYAVMHLWSSLA